MALFHAAAFGGASVFGQYPDGPRRGYVFGVATEFENVPLSQTHVFEQHPWRVRELRRLLPAKIRGKVFYGGVEFQVCATAVEKVDKILAQVLIVVFCHSSPPRAALL